jgi:hypothetical protein
MINIRLKTTAPEKKTKNYETIFFEKIISRQVLKKAVNKINH